MSRNCTRYIIYELLNHIITTLYLSN